MTRGRALALAGAAVAAAAGTGVAAAALATGAPDRARAPRIVSVAVTSPAGAAALATGFAAGGDRVVTVAHVLDATGAPTVDGRRARVVRIDRRDDLALLAVAGLPGAPRVRATAAGHGTRLLLRGGPRSARIRRAITATVTIAPDAPVRRRALDVAADVMAGDSGAPLVDGRGRVVGVVFAASQGRAHTAYAVDGGAVAALLRGAS